jgi:hypothetical protein
MTKSGRSIWQVLRPLRFRNFEEEEFGSRPEEGHGIREERNGD